MRCGRFDLLVDRYVDGALERRLAIRLQGHARACRRCAARLASAREMAAGLAAAPRARAPGGFAEAVMNAVSLEALKSRESVGEAQAAARGFRRLGFSLVLGAAALTASFFLPRAPWAAIGGQGGGAVVKQALDGADRAVRAAMRSVEGRFR